MTDRNDDAPTPCGNTTCPEVCYTRYCPACEPEFRGSKRARDRRASAAARGYGGKHRKRRERFLRLHTICMNCWSKPSAHLDHRIPLEEGGDDDWPNYQALCGTCHNTKSAREGAARRRRQREAGPITARRTAGPTGRPRPRRRSGRF